MVLVALMCGVVTHCRAVGPSLLGYDDSNAQWSPDGGLVAFVTQTDLGPPRVGSTASIALSSAGPRFAHGVRICAWLPGDERPECRWLDDRVLEVRTRRAATGMDAVRIGDRDVAVEWISEGDSVPDEPEPTAARWTIAAVVFALVAAACGWCFCNDRRALRFGPLAVAGESERFTTSVAGLQWIAQAAALAMFPLLVIAAGFDLAPPCFAVIFTTGLTGLGMVRALWFLAVPPPLPEYRRKWRVPDGLHRASAP